MCKYSDDFLSSDDFYKLVLRLIAVISFPVHFFTAFIILFKTPNHMSTVKWELFLLHFCSAFLDLYVTILTIPLMLFPTTAGYPLGLLVHLNIPTIFLIYFGFSFFAATTMAIVAFFEGRYQALVIDASFRTVNKKWRNVFHSINFIVSFLFFIPPIIMRPDIDVGTEFVKKMLPCLPNDFFRKPGFLVLTTDSLLPVICVSIMTTFVVAQLLFFIFAVINFLTQKRAVYSSATYRLKRKYFHTFIVQFTVPFILLIFPIVAIFVNYLFARFDQAFNNICVIIISCHGLCSAILVLVAHKPYRNACSLFFSCQ